MNFAIVHTTEYNYNEPVSVSHHVARLSPRAVAHQDCVRHELQIEPTPSAQATHVDYFGNTMTFFAMQGAHNRLTVRARSTVAVRATPRPNPLDTPPWDAAPDPPALPLDAIAQPSLEGTFPLVNQLLDSTEDDLRALSDAITHFYFSHAELRVN